MASEYTISQIVTFGENSQVNSTLDISERSIFNGKSLDADYARKLYMVRMAVSFVNNAIPGYSTLRQTAEYLYALSRPFAASAATIAISNPSNANVNVGQNASFTVSVFVSNAAPFTIQWYRNSVAIPGATSLTYTLVNAQLTDNGAGFNAIATSVGVGQAVSATATITVVAPLFGFFSFSATTDYYPILLTNSDPFSYQVTFGITHNSPVSIGLPPLMPSNQFMLVKLPSGENTKTTWFNTVLNNGTIPDAVFETLVTFGGFTYYASRGQITMDVTQVLTLS